MDLKLCDMRQCSQTYNQTDGVTVTFLDKQYDLCSDCYRRMKGWAQEFLGNGRDIPNHNPYVYSMGASVYPVTTTGIMDFGTVTASGVIGAPYVVGS